MCTVSKYLGSILNLGLNTEQNVECQLYTKADKALLVVEEERKYLAIWVMSAILLLTQILPL